VQIDILGEMQFEVEIEGMQSGKPTSSGANEEAEPVSKPLPPWMWREGMTAGATSEPAATSMAAGSSDAKVNLTVEEDPMAALRSQLDEQENEDADEAALQAEYVKAYLAALQQAQLAGPSEEEREEEEPDAPPPPPVSAPVPEEREMTEVDEWEDAAPGGTGDAEGEGGDDEWENVVAPSVAMTDVVEDDEWEDAGGDEDEWEDS